MTQEERKEYADGEGQRISDQFTKELKALCERYEIHDYLFGGVYGNGYGCFSGDGKVKIMRAVLDELGNWWNRNLRWQKESQDGTIKQSH